MLFCCEKEKKIILVELCGFAGIANGVTEKSSSFEKQTNCLQVYEQNNVTNI